jgi:hypothetical protein
MAWDENRSLCYIQRMNYGRKGVKQTDEHCPLENIRTERRVRKKKENGRQESS